MKKLGLRTLTFGMHNPFIHGATIIVAWFKLYRRLPSMRELLCIFVHDFGYINQDVLDGEENRHPELGARMCSIFGRKYYELCIAHSREYTWICKIPLSRLGFADKYSILMYPSWFFKILITFGGEAEEYYKDSNLQKAWGVPIDVERIKKSYREWMRKYWGAV